MPAEFGWHRDGSGRRENGQEAFLGGSGHASGMPAWEGGGTRM